MIKKYSPSFWKKNGSLISPTIDVGVSVGGTTSGQSNIASGLVVNEDGGNGANDDFRVETFSNEDALVVDASADEVIININTKASNIYIPSDSNKLYLGAGNDASLDYDGTNANIRTDLVAPSDLNIDCGTDKTIVLEDTVWDDMRVVPGSFDRPGASDPTITAIQPGGSGTTTYLYRFEKDNIASFTIQLPHNYKVGTDIYCHVHWTPGDNGVAENGNFVGWKLEYTWASINGAFGTMNEIDLSDACDGTNWKHQMTPDIAITGTDKGISSMLICNIKRTDTGTDDTWAGTGISSPLLLEIDFHYEIDTMGSRQKAAK